MYPSGAGDLEFVGRDDQQTQLHLGDNGIGKFGDAGLAIGACENLGIVERQEIGCRLSVVD